jgi:tetratricopeptide (TPR) repeat protein
MRIFALMLSLLIVFVAGAQKTNQLIEKGNKAYKKKTFAKADQQYTKVLQKDEKNTVAQFNSGNTKQQLKKYAEATKHYEAAANTSDDPLVKAQAFYNQGIAYIRQDKLKEAINAFKKALRYNPNDKDTRENLQKALKEEKQRQQPKPDDQQQNKDKKKPEDKKKPQPERTKLSKEEAEKMLNDLQKEEKNLQKQVQKKNQSSRQLKDW